MLLFYTAGPFLHHIFLSSRPSFWGLKIFPSRQQSFHSSLSRIRSKWTCRTRGTHQQFRNTPFDPRSSRTAQQPAFPLVGPEDFLWTLGPCHKNTSFSVRRQILCP